jgi:hypothetical protein
MTRQEAAELATRSIDHLDQRLREHGRGILRIGRDAVTLIGVLRVHLIQFVADVLQESPHARSIPERAKDTFRLVTGSAKQRVLNRAYVMRGFGAFSTLPRIHQASFRVLALPRAEGHLRDMIPVSREAAERHATAFAWMAFRPDHARAVYEVGGDVVLAGCYADPGAKRIARCVEELAEARDRLLPGPRPILDPKLWTNVADRVHAYLVRQLPYVLATVEAYTKAIAEVDPDVIFVGNPLTMEGTLGVAAGRAYGVAAATMQHGDISPRQTEWADAPPDLMTVWGARPKEILVGLGFPNEQIQVTGAPWVDVLTPKNGASKNRKKRILVALSGAGHSIGIAEHEGHVRRLLEATRDLPQHDWLFRLHPKDQREIYERILSTIPGARATIVESRHSKVDIHAQLEETDILITVTSASAFDAMLHGVPVVTLERPRGEGRSTFVMAGATTDVPAGESLAEHIARILADGQDSEVRRQAEAYVVSIFGPRDGRATERVAAAIVDLARRRRTNVVECPPLSSGFIAQASRGSGCA